jgi:hypothetical protein
VTGVWEIRVVGRYAGRTARKEYTFVRFNRETASAEALRLAALDGLEEAEVWAAVHLRDAPATEPPPASDVRAT